MSVRRALALLIIGLLARDRRARGMVLSSSQAEVTHLHRFAVKGLDHAAILDAFERRIGNDAETEFAAAVGQVHRIALLRLESLCG